MSDVFLSDRYLVRRKIMKLVGGAFHVWDANGALVAYSQQKAFKLKEDVRIYSDESKTRELMSIRARTVIDFSAVYDVIDSDTGQPLGSLGRRGMNSLLRDEWVANDAQGSQVAVLIEDSLGLALVRRILSGLVPQKYDVFMPDTATGQKVASLDQNFNPFVYKLNVDFTFDPDRRLDRRMGIAMAILLAAIEGRQQ